MPAKLASARSLLSLWASLSKLSTGRWLFSRLFGFFVPYSGSIKASVIELKPGYSRIGMRDRRAVRNHLNSIHAIALTNLGEIASGLALNIGLPENVRGIVVQIRSEYLKKARGNLVAECQFEMPTVKHDLECEVESIIKDISGEQVAKVTVVWRLGLR